MHKEPLLARARRAVADTVLEPLAGKAIDAAMRAGLARLADAVHKTGGQPLDITLPDGSHLSLGGPARALLRLQDPAALALMLHPNLEQLGEAFVQGRIDIEGDMLEAIRAAEALARAAGHPTEQRGMAPRARHASGQDAADIAFHYDVGNDFYRLWLDERWVYSCAYFKSPEATLDQAQRDKLDHICRKLQLTAGDRFLDVGCGWGALVMHAARHYGVQAVGITLSQAQWAHAQSRIASEGLTEQAKVLRLDYRQLPEHFGKHRFDKIASVGMFEHVGLQQLPIYFGAVAEVLRDRGLFLNHGITASDVQSRPVGSG
ncbi:MAG TPA: cyclopropane-fatty-acyl-phospholipid synthase family protein, partial [Burkholderiaceae bacterium]|nr:cyclopropane-fatty-acyl-phospholipid synthase family protein [Burkholderiaceae bacterium]